MTMSAVNSRYSPTLMVPATGFAEIIAPFRHDEALSMRPE